MTPQYDKELHFVKRRNKIIVIDSDGLQVKEVDDIDGEITATVCQSPAEETFAIVPRRFSDRGVIVYTNYFSLVLDLPSYFFFKKTEEDLAGPVLVCTLFGEENCGLTEDQIAMVRHEVEVRKEGFKGARPQKPLALGVLPDEVN